MDNKEIEVKEFSLQGLTFPDAATQLATGFTVGNIKTIYDHLMLGMTVKDCANLSHLPVQRLNTWWKSNYCGFGEMVEHAFAINKRHYIAKIYDAKDSNDIKASTWMLERKHKEEYTKETIINVNHHVVSTFGDIMYGAGKEFIKDQDVLERFMQYVGERLDQASSSIQDASIEAVPLLTKDT